MTGHGEKLSLNKQKAIAALISEPSIPKAAKVVGVGEKTLWRWLKDENFKKEYQASRNQIVIQVFAQVQAGLTEAVNTLREVMKNKKAPASSRVSAAKTMLDIGVKSIDVEDLEKRISEIEERINGDR